MAALIPPSVNSSVNSTRMPALSAAGRKDLPDGATIDGKAL